MTIELRKSQVVFRQEDHTYWLGERQLKGVTGTLIRRAFPDKYSDVPEEVLKKAAAKGSKLHEAVEFFDRFGYTSPETEARLGNYERVKKENSLTTIENEYLVSDEETYASSIDIVMQDGKGEVVLVDIKTTYSLDKQSVALQLSIYKRLFEIQNPDLRVGHLYALWLPNKDESICELVEVPLVDEDVILALMKAEEEDTPFVLNPTPTEFADIELELRHWMEVEEEAKANIDAIREKVMAMMVEKDLTQIKTGYFTVSYIPAKVGKKFDSTAFKKDHADMYKEYQKESETKASLRLIKK